ncbi:hypothetical protein, conserved [Babesia ovata]|uniref:Uncharacterized protein n=1 Tax=Babesia ovata TaxID=189622 RepID=A0A2H6KK43_9APIC|nr:uncharacterized protein BOVATA_048500 [Babesia ovata]GBE63357.1 hypothetical protein, conserved [Babesia ovata]
MLKNHLKEEQKTSENLVNILSQCKLNPSEDPLNELKTSIPQKIQELEEQKKVFEEQDKALKNEGKASKNASEIDKLNKDLQSHQASKRSLETLKELCDFAKKIQKNNENPKKLLESLCGGLEKFLGFKNGNYTGEGIVYSDLDRLCDGVMSFLHGVLDNIQPKLGLHSHHITTAIESLKLHKHSGKEGFNTAIVKVAEGVNKYNVSVREGNEKVSAPIKKLQDFLTTGEWFKRFNSLQAENISGYPKVEDLHVTSADGLVKECLGNAEKHFRPLDIAITNNNDIETAINDLNYELRDKVNKARKTIRHEIDLLTQLSMKAKADREAVKNQVTEQLDNLNEDVKQKTKKRMEKLREFLLEKVKSINELLVDVNAKLKGYVKDLDQWIKDAEAYVVYAIKMAKKMTEKDFVKTEDEAIKAAATKLLKDGQTLWTAYENANALVTEAIATATSRIDGLKNDVVLDLEELRDAIKSKVGDYISKLAAAIDHASERISSTYSGQGVSALYLKLDNKSQLYQVLYSVAQNRTDLTKDLENAMTAFRHAKSKWKGKNPIPTPDSLIEALSSDTKKQIQDAYDERNNGHVGVDPTKKILTQNFENKKDIDKQAINDISAQLQETEKPVDEGSIDGALFETQSKQVTENLMMVLQKFISVGSKNKVELETLNGTFEAIKNAKTNIHTLRTSELKEAMKQTSALITALPRAIDNTYKDIDKYLSDHVKKAKASILNVVNKRYVTSIQLILNQFADKISTELDGLPEAINRDLRIGHKGLMRTMQGVFVGSNTTDENIKRLQDLATNMSSLGKKEAFQQLCNVFQYYFGLIKDYVDGDITRVNEEENRKKNPSVPKLEDPYASMFQSIFEAFNNLLTHLNTQHRYDHKVPEMLDDLESALSQLRPKDFSLPNSPTLDGVTAGLGKFTGELRKVYISTYDSQTFEHELEDAEFLISNTGNRTIKKLSGYGEKCSKVLLTAFPMIHKMLMKLNKYGNMGWKREQIINTNNLGKFFTDNGYKVNSEPSKQTGELWDHADRTGSSIATKLAQFELSNVLTSNRRPLTDVISELHTHLQYYNQTCHIRNIQSPKMPCNIHQMLTWFSGLPHNRVHKNLTDHILKLFSKPENVDVPKPSDYILNAYPSGFSAQNIIDALNRVCHKSHDVLVAIQGHGHADGIYACDFYTNVENLSYPSNMDTLLCLLLGIAKRIYQQLHFLYQQCTFDTTMSGWSDCWYGQGVGGSAWQCNTLQCPNQNDDQCANQGGTQTADQLGDQPCKQHPKCGLKSSLQSFLEDGLQGFLPHVLTSGKGITCLTCTKTSSGMPCQTPMGYPEIAVTASHRQTGEHIKNVLHTFCGNLDSPLTKLCARFNCLMPSPPVTLGGMFAFFYGLFNNWSKSDAHRKTALHNAVTKAHFGVEYNDMDNCYKLFESSKHSSTQTQIAIPAIQNVERI